MRRDARAIKTIHAQSSPVESFASSPRLAHLKQGIGGAAQHCFVQDNFLFDDLSVYLWNPFAGTPKPKCNQTTNVAINLNLRNLPQSSEGRPHGGGSRSAINPS